MQQSCVFLVSWVAKFPFAYAVVKKTKNEKKVWYPLKGATTECCDG